MKKLSPFLFTLCITLMVLLQQAGAQCAKPVVISKAATVCAGGTTTLFTKQDASLTYSWSNGGNTASITAGAGTYTLTTTDGSGCSQTSDPVVIKEKALFPPVIPSDTPVLCSGQSLTLYADTGNVWVRKPDFPAAAGTRNEGVGFSIGSKGYVGGGTGSGFLSDFWEYDEATETWSQKANIPGSSGRVFATGIAIDDKGYVGLGNGSSGTFGDWWEYDPFTNTWTAKANFPGGPTTAATGFVAGNLGYVGLGQKSGTFPLNFWSYNPATDTWAPVASFPGTGRREPVAFGINGKGYVTTGWLLAGANNANDCWQYDPATDTWTAQPDLPGQGRRTSTAFTIQDHAYVVCGYANVIGSTNELWEFYNGAWKKKTSFGGNPQWGPLAFGLHDKAIVCFGAAGTRQVWEYHPNNTVQWPNGSTQLSYTINTPGSYTAAIKDIEGCSIATAPLTVTPAGFTTPPISVSSGTTICEGTTDTLYAGGDVWTKKNDFPGGSSYYASGFTLGSTGYYCGGSPNVNQFWKYDAATDTWAQQASMPMQVTWTSAIGWNGKGWVVGNSDKTMYMYDPVYNTWVKKSTGPISARDIIQGFLLNDKIIIAGGFTGSITTAEVWEYDPVKDTWTRKNNMPFGMSFAPAFALNGKGYLVTGNSTRTNSAGPQSTDCLQYDPAADSWTVMPNFPGALRGGGIGFTDGHKGYVGMGNTNGAILSDLWQLDPATLTWTRMTDIPRGRYSTVAMVIGQYAYISTGAQNAGGNMDVWQYEMPYNYQWSTGATTRYIKVTQTGDYSVQVSTNGGCSATTPAVHITVQPKTIISAPPQDVTICDASPASFSVNAAGTNITYQWQLNGGNINDGTVYSGATTNALNVANVNGLGAGQFQCVVTGTCGTATSTAATLTVNPLPAKPAISAGGVTTFCQGGSVTLSSPAAAGYTWSNGATIQNIPVTTTGSYTVKVTDGNGCVSPLSDAVVVTVNPLPVQPAITAGSATTFCQGGSVTLSGPAAAAYAWSTGSTTKQIVITRPGAYTLQVTDANGCESPLSNGVLVTVNPLPAQPVITASGPLSFCDGKSVTLSTATAAGYQWSNGSRTGSVTVNRDGNYTVRITDNNGCTSPVSDAVTVTVNSYPTGQIAAVGPFVSGNTHYMQLTAPATNGTYAWSTGDHSATTRVTQSGTYGVAVITAQGCERDFDIAVQLIDLNQIPNTFSPNHDGINDYWTVKALDQYPNAVVQIFNRNGNKVFEAKGAGLRWDGTSGGRELPAGVYFYVLDLKDGGKPVNGWINLLK